ncbi:hypothetical protein PN419_09310 [Halorubrum ezzemoulense]|uniref:hypothetical protein n=1 Tax=Halorubrum ezzemoulense TaxID=337243 RepID=UPI00232C9120|nr:hypothetical protein [Halorubrum ezzemoulense]MDB9249188.1 hypothetical protein [Halorubrum ezzemoulense]MDB9259656.1 hypothetical protein [Halorubrum ezzemoulense]MDB9263121.1 hypothetical protein [Halorubrum ezzemoulense]MDB9266449.1 hypothetical protein [Halorubrum ezzemoulense]MDB9270017.1 hypothetical protein [Halorubrum ezzemoulense]
MGDETGVDGSRARDRARAAVRTSRLGRLWDRATDAVRDSFLYRWLTAEPDPDVIVIDLRETWTVGPFIRLLDAVLDRLLPALDDSRLATAARAAARYTLAAPVVVGGLAVLVAGLGLGLASVAGGTLGTTRLGVAAGLVAAGAVATRERRSWAELRETRPVELLVAALEPPEPSDADASEADAADPDASDSDVPTAEAPEAERSGDDRSRTDG